VQLSLDLVVLDRSCVIVRIASLEYEASIGLCGLPVVNECRQGQHTCTTQDNSETAYTSRGVEEVMTVFDTVLQDTCADVSAPSQ
jgi:hypothetical protein